MTELRHEFRCGCCKHPATKYRKVAWCPRHDIYECEVCWEHAHDPALEEWGDDGDEAEDADPTGSERPGL